MTGKTAIVTGGAQGIGASICERFCAEGGQVVIADTADAAGEDLAARLRSQGGDAQFLHLDVTDEANWCAAIADVTAVTGRIDILVNNAGIALGILPMAERDVADGDRVMSVNARGVFLGVKHVVPVMIRGGGGSIVNLSSAAALGQWQNMEAAYAASKAAVHVFSKAAGTQYAEQGIRCNTVVIGVMHTPLVEQRLVRQLGAEDAAALIAQRHAQVPIGRMGDAWDAAHAVLFLVSDEARYITGTEIVVDGGISAARP